jgi:hypothetical protein
MAYGKCRVCGCTERRACLMPGPCYWIDKTHEHCSACVCDECARVFEKATQYTTSRGKRICRGLSECVKRKIAREWKVTPIAQGAGR